MVLDRGVLLLGLLLMLLLLLRARVCVAGIIGRHSKERTDGRTGLGWVKADNESVKTACR